MPAIRGCYEVSSHRREIAARLENNRKQWRALKSTLQFGEPKSQRSRRTLRMPQVVIAALKAHRRRQLEERMALRDALARLRLGVYVANRNPLDPRNVTREFHSMLTKVLTCPTGAPISRGGQARRGSER